MVATGATTIVFLSLAAAPGAGSGAVFALVARRAPDGKAGAVTTFAGSHPSV